MKNKIHAKFVCVFCLCFLSYSLCDCKITLNAHVSSSALLDGIATQCALNIIYTQNSKQLLDKQKTQLRFSNESLENVLRVILDKSDIGYVFDGKTLELKALQTKTFSINYISTARVGSSNTDVFFSQDSYNMLYQTPAYGYGLDSESQAHKMALNKAAQNTLGIGKSGTKIYSIDEMDFWGELENEIYSIAYRPGDWYKPDSEQKNIVINKGAGLLTITGSRKQIARVEEYIGSLVDKIHSQVLIDVNIFNIEHSNTSTYGVDWEQFFGLLNFSSAPIGSPDASSFVLGSAGNSYGINIFSQGVSIERIIEFLETYGKVESLSNPRVLTLNNQPAIISVGSVLRYSQNTTFQTTTQGTSVQNASQAFPSVFAGILLDVTPSIEGTRVILKINPSITKTKDSSTENQTTALASPPNLSTKHLSSLVAIENGQKIVLGGLMDKTQTKTRKKLPLLGDIPLLKYLFSYTKNIEVTKEMIIVISPHIIGLGDGIPQDAKKFLEKVQ